MPDNYHVHNFPRFAGSQVTEYSCELTHSPTPSSNVRNVTFRYSAKLDYSNSMSEDHKPSDD